MTRTDTTGVADVQKHKHKCENESDSWSTVHWVVHCLQRVHYGLLLLLLPRQNSCCQYSHPITTPCRRNTTSEIQNSTNIMATFQTLKALFVANSQISTNAPLFCTCIDDGGRYVLSFIASEIIHDYVMTICVTIPELPERTQA